MSYETVKKSPRWPVAAVRAPLISCLHQKLRWPHPIPKWCSYWRRDPSSRFLCARCTRVTVRAIVLSRESSVFISALQTKTHVQLIDYRIVSRGAPRETSAAQECRRLLRLGLSPAVRRVVESSRDLSHTSNTRRGGLCLWRVPVRAGGGSATATGRGSAWAMKKYIHYIYTLSRTL